MPEQTIKFDPRLVDKDYQPFPSFEAWSSATTLDVDQWKRSVEPLQSLRRLPREVFAKARSIATRASAVDTGAIEGLYETDRGFTFSVATEGAAWEAAAAGKGPLFRGLFEGQLKAYEYVLDFATRNRPFAEALIRTLHEEICAGQETYQVYTEVGVQTRPLPKGQYKTNPNHVLLADGSIHAYCPVDLTPSEMHRLVSELQSEAFNRASPVQQAAYAHYAFVAIHPFPDGNGRVARA